MADERCIAKTTKVLHVFIVEDRAGKAATIANGATDLAGRAGRIARGGFQEHRRASTIRAAKRGRPRIRSHGSAHGAERLFRCIEITLVDFQRNSALQDVEREDQAFYIAALRDYPLDAGQRAARDSHSIPDLEPAGLEGLRVVTVHAFQGSDSG